MVGRGATRRWWPARGRSGRPNGLIVASVLSAMVMLVSGFGWVALESIDAKLQRADVGLTGPTSSITDEAQTILLVGSDDRGGLTQKQIKALHLGPATAENGAGRRSDTMILMHLSKARDQVTMISLPRDSYVRIPAWTDSSGKNHAASNNKLNAAFAFGGPKLAVKTIEANTGVTIDHYVEVNFQGFVSMVDALGGVDVCVKKAIHDDKSGLDLPKGKSTLDGAQGLAFVRARYFDPRADIGRIERQQQFLGAMFRAATASDVLLNPAKLGNFLDAALASVTVDNRITRNDMLALAETLQQVAAGNVDFLTVPIADYDYRDGEHGSSVRWDRQAATELFAKVEADEAIVPVESTTHRRRDRGHGRPWPGEGPGAQRSRHHRPRAARGRRPRRGRVRHRRPTGQRRNRRGDAHDHRLRPCLRRVREDACCVAALRRAATRAVAGADHAGDPRLGLRQGRRRRR